MVALEHLQVPQEALDVLAQYRHSTGAVRSDREHKLALARTFVPPGRCASSILPPSLRLFACFKSGPGSPAT